MRRRTLRGQNGRVIEDAIQLETNVDDMDPRLWPHVIDCLLQAGAHDAWLTPILMKKGRPAHTLSALCDATTADAVRAAIFAETTTIGIRETAIRKHVLDRTEATVEVEGHPIGVKLAFDGGIIVNRSVEWDHVLSAASALGWPAKRVAQAASEQASLLEAE